MSPIARVDVSPPENSTTVRVDVRVESGRSEPATPAAVHAARAALRLAAAASPDVAASMALRLFTTPQRGVRRARELEALGRARRFLIPFRDRALVAWEWGEAGPRVLLVHGWQGRAGQLAPIAESLASIGFRVVGVDMPAHGDSPGERATLFDFADAIEASSVALGTLHAIVSHSMGGAATAWATRAHGLAKRYVAIAPPADLRDFTGGFARYMGVSSEVRDRLERRIEERYGVSLEDARVERSASTQRAPLLVVHDLGDTEVPFDKGRRYAAAWAGARLVRTEGLGHNRILRDGGVVRAVTRFVAWGTT